MSHVAGRTTQAARPTRPADGFSHQTSGRLSGRRPLEFVVLLTVAAAALRFGTLDVQSVWLDESATLVLVRRGFSGMLSHLAQSESSPPLYYVLVWAWTKVFGTSVLGFRSFSALVGTITVPVMYGAGSQISKRIGLWAAALAVVNPAMYYYSQEARAYGLLILFCAVALIFWQAALRDESRRSIYLWALASILALVTHYFAAFMFAPEAILLARRLGIRRVRVPIGLVVLTGIALLPLAASEHTAGKADWIEHTSLISRLAEAPKQYLVGLSGPISIVTALIAGLLALGALALLLWRARPSERASAIDLVWVGAGALALPILLSATHAIDVFDGRNVIATWSVYALLVAAGAGIAGASRIGPALGAALCALSLAVVVAVNLIPGYQRDDWRGAAGALADTRGSVVVTPAEGLLPLSIYAPDLRKERSALVNTRELQFVALRTLRTGRSPLAPVVPTVPPPGYRLAELKRSETYAVARFIATRARSTSVRSLQLLGAGSGAEVLVRE
jgi:mannosyltransferase